MNPQAAAVMTARRPLWLALLAIGLLTAIASWCQDSTEVVKGLLQDVRDPDSEKASAAAQDLAAYPQQRSQIIPALIEVLRTGQWDRCNGDMREQIAWTLEKLNAREAVLPLLDLAKSGRPIEHECAE